MKMGRILIFEDIVNDLSARPREVTLIGEENLISRKSGCNKDYDLYYYYFNGAEHNTNLDARFKQIPVFLNFEMQTLGDYAKIADVENHILKYVDECNFGHPKIPNKPHTLMCGKQEEFFDYERSPKDIIGFYGTDRKLLLCDYNYLKALKKDFKKAGLKGKSKFSIIEREELFRRLEKNGIFDFKDKLRKRCEYLNVLLLR